MPYTARSYETSFPQQSPTTLPTLVVQGTIEVEAPRVEAGGQLYEVAGPGVPRPGEASQRHQLLGASGEETPVHTAVI